MDFSGVAVPTASRTRPVGESRLESGRYICGTDDDPALSLHGTKDELCGRNAVGCVEPELRDDTALYFGASGINALPLAETKLEAEGGAGIRTAGQIAVAWEDDGNLWLKLYAAGSPRVVGEPKACLWGAFIKRAKPNTQASCFQQTGQGGRSKRCPVLAEKRVDPDMLGSCIIHARPREADPCHAGPNGGDVPVTCAAKVSFEVELEAAGDGHLRRGIDPFEVAAETHSTGLEVEFMDRVRSCIKTSAQPGGNKSWQRKVIPLRGRTVPNHAGLEKAVRFQSYGPHLEVRDQSFALRRIHGEDSDRRYGRNHRCRRWLLCRLSIRAGDATPRTRRQAQDRRDNASAGRAIRGGLYDGRSHRLVVIGLSDNALGQQQAGQPPLSFVGCRGLTDHSRFVVGQDPLCLQYTNQ